MRFFPSAQRDNKKNRGPIINPALVAGFSYLAAEFPRGFFIATVGGYCPEGDVRLFRVIAWGAVIILAAFIAAIGSAKIAILEYTSEPVFVFVIPIALGLLFCWWIDVVPVVSRWLVACVAFVASIVCPAFAWIQPIWEQVQGAALVIYLVFVSREAWRQIRVGVGKEDEAEKRPNVPPGSRRLQPLARSYTQGLVLTSSGSSGSE